MCSLSPLAFFHAGIDVWPVTPWIFSGWLLPDSALLCQWNHWKTTFKFWTVHKSTRKSCTKFTKNYTTSCFRCLKNNWTQYILPQDAFKFYNKTSQDFDFSYFNFEKKHNPSFWTKWITPTATWLASKEPIILYHFRSSKQIKVGIKTPAKPSNTEWFRANINLPTT